MDNFRGGTNWGARNLVEAPYPWCRHCMYRHLNIFKSVKSVKVVPYPDIRHGLYHNVFCLVVVCWIVTLMRHIHLLHACLRMAIEMSLDCIHYLISKLQLWLNAAFITTKEWRHQSLNTLSLHVIWRYDHLSTYKRRNPLLPEIVGLQVSQIIIYTCSLMRVTAFIKDSGSVQISVEKMQQRCQ